MPKLWIYTQALIVLFVLIGIVIANREALLVLAGGNH